MKGEADTTKERGDAKRENRRWGCNVREGRSGRAKRQKKGKGMEPTKRMRGREGRNEIRINERQIKERVREEGGRNEQVKRRKDVWREDERRKGR